MIRIAATVVVSMALMASSLAQVSIEKEAALGQLMAADFERRSKLLSDPQTTEHLRRIAEELGGISGSLFPIKLKLLDTTDPRAVALPGGYLFISSGMIARAASEAELAAMIAHQIAHASGLHGLRQTLNRSAVPPIFMGPGGLCWRMTTPGFNPRGPAEVAKLEEDADLLALDYLRRIGYDPSALIGIFKKTGTGPRPESSPSVLQRLSRVMSAREYVVSTSEFEKTGARLRKPEPRPPSLERARTASFN